MPKIVLQSLVKKFGAFTAIDGMDLQVNEGEFLGFLGPSGCGKTTTLNIIAGFEDASSGRIILDGKDMASVPAHRRGIGIVFQSYALFPHMTAAENVAFGLEMRKLPEPEIKARVKEALNLVKLEQFSDRFPRQLSGGQQQRIALARALAIRPSLLLLDEPLSNLDAKLREEMQVELKAIQKAVNITTVMVTHDQAEAMSICDRIALMDGGRIVQLGTPLELYDTPATEFAAGFVGRLNKFSGKIAGRANGMATVRLDTNGQKIEVREEPGRASSNSNVLVVVRPEKTILCRNENGRLSGTLRSTIFQGSSWLHQIETAVGDVWVCELNEGQTFPTTGSTVEVSWEDAHSRVVLV